MPETDTSVTGWGLFRTGDREDFTDDEVVAKVITETGNGLNLRHGELWANELLATHELGALIRRGIDMARAGGRPRQNGITLERRDGKRPFYAKVNILWQNNLPFKFKPLSRPVAAIYVTDPEVPQEAQTETLQRLFGLSQREVDLVACLVKGHNLQISAEVMAVSVNTVRACQNHLCQTAHFQPDRVG